MIFQEFEDKLQKAKTTKQLNQALTDYLGSFSLTSFGFTLYQNIYSEENTVRYSFATERYQLWHEYYISEGYDKLDTTYDVIKSSILPIAWDIKQQIAKAKSPLELKMRQDSLEFGTLRGISIPLYGPHDDFAILVLIQMRDDKEVNIEKVKCQLISAAYFYFSYLRWMLIKNQKGSLQLHLSKREIQCLTLLAKQHSVTDIAKILFISEQGVHYHIQKIIKKFRVKNKYQAVLSALNKNIIKL